MDALIKEDRKHTVFAGHFHECTQYERNNYKYYQLATTGSISSLRGPGHGQFDQFGWVTMTKTGPRLAKLKLDGIYKDDIRTEEMAEIAFTLSRAFEVEIDPLDWALMEHNKSVETTLHIKNKAEIPMQVSGHFDAHEILQADPLTINTELAPLSEKEINIKIKFLKNFENLKALMLPLNIKLSFNPERYPGKFVCEETVIAAIDTFPIVPQANKKVSVDGDLSDWDSLPFTINNLSQLLEDRKAWTGPEDAPWILASLKIRIFSTWHSMSVTIH